MYFPSNCLLETYVHALVVWKEFLCSGHDSRVIIKWNDFNKKTSTLKGHTSLIITLVSGGDYLFSGSLDKTIRKWNEEGQCVAILQQHTNTVCTLLVFNGELYSASDDKTVKRWSLDGSLVQEYKGHTHWVKTVVVWRGALFSGGQDEQMIQWTPFVVAWSPSTHKQFSSSLRQGIKTMMMIESKLKDLFQVIPKDILFITFQFYASTLHADKIPKKRRL